MSNGPVNLVYYLAKRFLFSKSSDEFAPLITWISVLGVSLGVLALISVTSVINGFESELTRAITGMNSDVILYTRGRPIDDPQSIRERIIKILPTQIKSLTPTFISEVMISGPVGVSGGVLEGIENETLHLATEIPDRVIEGKLADKLDEVSLGFYLAEKVGAKVGDSIRIIIPFVSEEDDQDYGIGNPRSVEKKVVGIVKMGMYKYDSRFLFAPIESVRELLKQPGKITSFKIKLNDNEDTVAAAGLLTDHFGYPFRAKDWSQLNRNLLYSIELEKVVISIILTAIVIVAAFNTVSTLVMMIHDKTKELSILKAMGFTSKKAFRLFALIGMSIGIVGIASGVLGGLVVNQIIANTRLVDLPPDVYHIGYLPVIHNWKEIGTIIGIAFLISLLSALYPAITVSRRSPLDGIRYE